MLLVWRLAVVTHQGEHLDGRQILLASLRGATPWRGSTCRLLVQRNLEALTKLLLNLPLLLLLLLGQAKQGLLSAWLDRPKVAILLAKLLRRALLKVVDLY